MWFTDNINRRDRALQLANDISIIQKDITDSKAVLDKADERMLPYIDEMLKKNGLKSFDELKAKIEAQLTPEQKKSYEDLVKAGEEADDDVKTALKVTSAMVFITGFSSKAIDKLLLIHTGHVLQTIRAYGTAIIKIFTEGIEAGVKAFRVASKIGSYAAQAVKDVSKMTKYAASASKYLKILTIFGLFADIVVLGYSAYQEAEQRTALRTAIHDLFISRICCTMFRSMCDAIKTQNGLMLSYLLYVGDDGEVSAADIAAAEKIAQTIVANVKEKYDSITLESSLNSNNELDKIRNSWTKEDPSRDDALKEAGEQTSDNDQKSSVSSYGSEPTCPDSTQGPQAFVESAKWRNVSPSDGAVLEWIVDIDNLTKARLNGILAPVLLTV